MEGFFETPVHHDDGEVLAVVDELVHECHASGPSAHHKVVASEGGHLLKEPEAKPPQII